MTPALRNEYLQLLGLDAGPAIPPQLGTKPASPRLPSPEALLAESSEQSEKAAEKPPRRLVEVAQPPPANAASGADDADVPTLDWADLASKVATCMRCSLHQRRTQTVFGIGAQDAPLMLVGEGPGEQEDLLGEPFVGAAGQLLDNMLAAIDRSRAQDVYIANVVKCRPPGNRKPQDEEALACSAYLDRQIALVGPKLLVALGGAAATRLLGQDTPVGKLRGQIHDYRGTPVIVTYHPAYYLRKPADKRKGWDDLKRIRAVLADGG